MDEKINPVATYDYENDPRWKEYWFEALIPSHMLFLPEVKDHYKCKFYKCYINSNLVVQPFLSPISNLTPRPSEGSSSSVHAAEIERPRNSGPSNISLMRSLLNLLGYRTSVKPKTS